MTGVKQRAFGCQCLQGLLPCAIKLVTLRCKLKRGSRACSRGLGPLGVPEYESRLNSRSRVPLSTFSCRFYQFRWWSPAEGHWAVHVDCPRGQIQTFWVLSAQRPLQAPLSCPGVPPRPSMKGAMLGGSGLWALSTPLRHKLSANFMARGGKYYVSVDSFSRCTKAFAGLLLSPPHSQPRALRHTYLVLLYLLLYCPTSLL